MNLLGLGSQIKYLSLCSGHSFAPIWNLIMPECETLHINFGTVVPTDMDKFHGENWPSLTALNVCVDLNSLRYSVFSDLAKQLKDVTVCNVSMIRSGPKVRKVSEFDSYIVSIARVTEGFVPFYGSSRLTKIDRIEHSILLLQGTFKLSHFHSLVYLSIEEFSLTESKEIERRTMTINRNRKHKRDGIKQHQEMSWYSPSLISKAREDDNRYFFKLSFYVPFLKTLKIGFKRHKKRNRRVCYPDLQTFQHVTRHFTSLTEFCLTNAKSSNFDQGNFTFPKRLLHNMKHLNTFQVGRRYYSRLDILRRIHSESTS